MTTPAGSSSAAAKVVIGKKDPKALADMRNQLFSKSSASDRKETKPKQKSRIPDTPPPEPECEEPQAAELPDQSGHSQDMSEATPQSEEDRAGSVGQEGNEDEDEPLDIN